MKIWDKGKANKLNEKINAFNVGNDFLLDKRLVKYDCLASIAHAKMLKSIGILTEKELAMLIDGLQEIMKLDAANEFSIAVEDEDCHTAIEKYLTQKYGDVGKKIHTARSRNDQVLVAIRLYEKDALAEIKKEVQHYCTTLEKFIDAQGFIKLPGYTHMQKAMPMTVTMWLGSFLVSMKDNLKMIDMHLALIDQSPLGSAAGFGPPIEIDRAMTAELMQFANVMENPMYCQLSRGKFEAAIAHVATMILYDLNKFATDMLLFSTSEFGFVDLSFEICTGSSIMPQKKNPDVLELLRAKYHVAVGEEMKIKGIMASLPSGYNKDLQLTKEALFTVCDMTVECLQVTSIVIQSMEMNQEKCKAAMTPELFATKGAYELVKNGMSFRDAYKEVGKKYGGEK